MRKLLILLVLILILQLVLVACKNSKPKNARIDDNGKYETVTNVYKPTFIDLPEGYSIPFTNYRSFYKDDRIYFLSNNLINTSETEYKYLNTYAVHSLDTNGSDVKPILLDVSYSITNGVYSGIEIYRAGILSNDNFIAFAWDYGLKKFVLVKFDLDGSFIDSVVITNLPNIERGNILDMAVNDEDNVFICTRNCVYIIKNSQDTAVEIPIKSQTNIFTMTTYNGSVYVYENNGNKNNVGNVFYVNTKECTLEKRSVIKTPENIKSQSSLIYFYFGAGYDIYYKTYMGLYGYNADEKEAELLIDWGNSDIYEAGVNILSIISPETIVISYSSLLSSQLTTNSDSIAVLNKIPDDEVIPKIVINLAFTTNPSNFMILTQLAMRFNQTNDKYRIVFNDYSRYNSDSDYSRSTEMLNLDIVAGNISDMIVLHSMNIQNYTSKGLFANLYDYLDTDPALSRNDILRCVRTSYEINGELYHLPLSFKVDTLVGKSSNVGKEPYMTVSDMMKIYNRLPDDVCLISHSMFGDSGLSLLKLMLPAIIGDYIDYEKGLCTFTCDEFIDLLKFTRSYSIDSNYKGYSGGMYIDPSLVQYLRDDKIYMVNTSFRSINSYILYKFMLGIDDGTETEIVFKGYPTKSNNGSIIYSSYSIAITETSQCKEGAWEFIKYMLSFDIQSSDELTTMGIPVLTSALKTMLEQAQNHFYYARLDTLLSMNDMSYFSVISVDEPDVFLSREYDTYKITEADADNIFNFLNSIEIRNKNDDVINNIINEEINVYWAGQITAEQCAGYIQNRVSIYVSEQK